MSEPSNVATLPKQQLKPNQGFISGRVISARKINTAVGPLYLTVLRLPSAGEYDHPATVELRSNSTLAQNGDQWHGLINLRGMPNNYETTNKDTGLKVPVVSARNEFQVVE